MSDTKAIIAITGKVVSKPVTLEKTGDTAYRLSCMLPVSIIDGQIQYKEEFFNIYQPAKMPAPIEGNIITLSGTPRLGSSFSKTKGRWYHRIIINRTV